jgi:hypothetical protein
MEQNEKKSLNHYMRSLHRDIGFFVIGLTIIFSISGIVLVYRDSDFLKFTRNIERKLEPNIEASELGQILHLRDLKVQKTEGDIVYFENGTYNKTTGIAAYKSKELPAFLNRFSSFHKSASHDPMHLFVTLYGILLLFLALSSFWMFKTKSKYFKRGIYFSGAGLLVAIMVLLV